MKIKSGTEASRAIQLFLIRLSSEDSDLAIVSPGPGEMNNLLNREFIAVVNSLVGSGVEELV
jgi:hypothetical protein